VIGKKLVIVSVIVLATAASAVGLAAGTAENVATADQPAWQRALAVRSEALDRKYHLGENNRNLGAPGPGWRETLMQRSEALNRKYGLGNDAPTSTAKSTTPDWAKALQARSDALDRKYRLGKYAGK
jgi:hypothetical protein